MSEISMERVRRYLDDSVSEWTDALREFFLYEFDEDLGRWRWPERPEYVVYPGDDGVMVALNVVNERNGYHVTVYLSNLNEPAAFEPFCRAARAYIAAHPVPKPWHDAKPGEVWLLTYRNIAGHQIENPAIRTESNKWRLPIMELDFDDPITAGRRIYPEVSGDE